MQTFLPMITAMTAAIAAFVAVAIGVITVSIYERGRKR